MSGVEVARGEKNIEGQVKKKNGVDYTYGCVFVRLCLVGVI